MKRAFIFLVAVMMIVAAFVFFEWGSERLVSISKEDSLETLALQINDSEQRPESVVPEQDASGRFVLPDPQLPELTPSVIPRHLYPLFGWEDIGGYVPRRKLVEAIKHELSEDEVIAFLLFARCKPDEVGLTDHDFNGVADVVLLKLEEQKQLPLDYSDHLVVMFYDETNNDIWRDYCIQHLGTVYQRTSLEKRHVIRQLYEDSLKPGSPFAGTALIAMKRSVGSADMKESFVAKRAFDVALSSAYGDAERLSALHVAATFGHPQAVELAREVVPSKRSATFRAASLAVIGLNGEPSDVPLVQKYVQSSDIRLRVAAAEALKRLTK